MLFEEIIIAPEITDSYKLGHMVQYPENTTRICNNFTPRSSHYLDLGIPEEFRDSRAVVLGTQLFLIELKNLWQKTFFDLSIETVTKEFIRSTSGFTGPRGIDIDKIIALHKLGYLPLKIYSLPEGSCVNIRVPTMLVYNTHPDFFWLPNYIETYMSCELWKMSTNATIARIYRKIITKWQERTEAPAEFTDWQGHDFSMRGMDGWLSAAKSGMAHLTSFYGTDVLVASKCANYYYGSDDAVIRGSVPATEHSVMCMGSKETEIETFRRLIEDIYPSGIVSIVSDTWDFWKVITEYALQLKEKILSRIPDEYGLAKVVFRPDSGDPVKIISGYRIAPPEMDPYEMRKHGYEVIKKNDKYYEIAGYKRNELGQEEVIIGTERSTAEVKGAVECLWEIFGGEVTSYNYKVLNQRVGLIYGDSITMERCNEILQRLWLKKFASNNCVFGIGSYTYQFNTRDTLGYAVKSTYGELDGVPVELFKDPITDDGTKKSAKGMLRVLFNENTKDFSLEDQITFEEFEKDHGAFNLVFNDGKITSEETFEGIRQRIRSFK